MEELHKDLSTIDSHLNILVEPSVFPSTESFGKILRYQVIATPIRITSLKLLNLLILHSNGKRAEEGDDYYTTITSFSNKFIIDLKFQKVCKGNSYFTILISHKNQFLQELFIKVITSHTAVQILRKDQKGKKVDNIF